MHTAMPEQGRDSTQILEELESFKDKDPKYKEGRVWSLVYYLNEDHSDFLKEAYHGYACENGLNPGAFNQFVDHRILVVRDIHPVPGGCRTVPVAGDVRFGSRRPTENTAVVFGRKQL